MSGEDFGKFPPIKAIPATPEDTGTIAQQAPQAAEAIPEKLDVVVDFGDDTKLSEIVSGPPGKIAAAIDMGSGKMYIGDGHNYLFHKYKIPVNQFCKVIVELNGPDDITVPFAFDLRGERPKTIKTSPLKNLVVETLKQYLKNERA